jgi:hypothetical protein
MGYTVSYIHTTQSDTEETIASSKNTDVKQATVINSAEANKTTIATNSTTDSKVCAWSLLATATVLCYAVIAAHC